MESEVEKLIVLYIVICIALIGFNFVSIFIFRLYRRLVEKKSRKMRRRFGSKLQDGASGLPADASGRQAEEKDPGSIQLTGIDLLALEKTIDEQEGSDPEAAERMRSAFRKAAYEGITGGTVSDPIVLAYVLHLAKKYRVFGGSSDRELTQRIKTLACEDDFYLRQNAIELLISLGDADALLAVLHELDRKNISHNEKLLHDEMLEFRGDKEQLWRQIWKEFNRFSPAFQVMLIKYMQFESGAFRRSILRILTDENRDEEVRLACIRYLTRHPYEKARPVIYGLLRTRKERPQEYAAVAAAALASYPGEDTKELLEELLSDPHWYVRKNAAEAVHKLGYESIDADEILDGDDRYAREALQYNIDRKDLAKEEKQDET